MADRLAEPDDAAVDELKRKARRRLVGAIVLALAAAIVVPMLLEREPRSLGDEVSVQIPPVDDGKFVNRLNGAKDDATVKPGAKAQPSTSSAPAREAPASPSPAAAGSGAPPKSITEAEQRVLAPPAHPPTSAAIPADQKATAPAEVKPEPTQPVPEPQAVAPAKSEPPKQEPVATSTAASAASPAAAAAPARAEHFVVQLAAFADDKGANALAGKLKRAGYPAYTEPVQTSRGTLWRVRVGAYASRDAASDARAKLKNDGFSGIVATAQ